VKLDYGQLLRRAWDIIWANKFLILLGVLVALTNGGNTSGTGTRYQFNDSDFHFDQPMPRDFEELPQIPELQRILREWGFPIAVGGALLVIGIVLAIVIGLGIWVISTLARGGLIAGVNTIVDGGVSSFSQAFSAGLAKGWRLLGISILPGIPGLILLIFALGVGGFSLGLTRFFDTNWAPFGAGAMAIIGGLICIVAPIAIALGLLRTFAERACVLEDLGVIDSYKRGWKILSSNIGPAIVLFLIQIGISIALGLVTIGPAVMMTLCCVLWPVLLLAQGAIAAYFSTLWTLAWREWTAPAENGMA